MNVHAAALLAVPMVALAACGGASTSTTPATSLPAGASSAPASVVMSPTPSATSTAAATPTATGTYGQQAKDVAASIGCTNVSNADGATTATLSNLVCFLHGTRINIITFKSEAQQAAWETEVGIAYPNGGWLADRPGLVSIAKDGNKTAAQVAAKALGGTVTKIS